MIWLATAHEAGVYISRKINRVRKLIPSNWLDLLRTHFLIDEENFLINSTNRIICEPPLLQAIEKRKFQIAKFL